MENKTNEWYDEWREKVRKVPNTMSVILGKDWETDKDNRWTESCYNIIRNEQYDFLTGLLDYTTKMMALLSEAENFIASSINEPVKDTEVIVKLKEIESKTDILFDKIMPDSKICEKLENIKQGMDKLCAERDTKNNAPSEKSAEMSIERDGSVPHYGVKRSDKRQNVMVFLPTDRDSCDFDEKVEDVLTYLGCDKESIQEIEVVRDKGDDCDDKIVLRVHMDSVKQATKALANAFKLKRYPGIYIARDMTIHQQIKLRDLVRKLRSKIQLQPKYRWKIVDWEVVNVGLFNPKYQKEELKYSYTEMRDNLSD